MMKISLLWLPLLLAALAVTTVFASERDIEIHFQKRTAVNGDRVVLGDVATIYAKSLKNFEKLASLVIGQMPSESNDLSVPSEYVRIRVDEALGGMKLSVKINAPDLIEFYKMKVESKSEHLAKEIQRQAIEFKKIPAGIELISEISTNVDLQKLNLDDYRLEPAAENREWRGHLVFRLSPKSGMGDSYWINTRLRWFMNSWVAKTTIPFFKDIDAGAFEPGKVEVTQMTEIPIAAGEPSELERLVKETRAKRSLRPGMALTASMLDRKPDIKSGQKLKVVFIAESGVRVATDGVVMNDGVVGDSIKARLKTSKKIVSGKLVSPEVVEVSL
jgi:flagella basal body P-ring formation protein FlgA